MSAVDYLYIDEDKSFNDYCEKILSCKCIGIDTEFISEKTFSPLLCLIIIHSEKGTAIIDPFKISNFEPLKKILVSENIIKITHAGENDYKIFYNDMGIVPVNIFDTQIVAGIIYADYPISLEKLLYRELKVSLPKSSTVSDWSQRPLSNRQLDYAVLDVFHLVELKDKLENKLAKLGRDKWLDAIQNHHISVDRFAPPINKTIAKHRFSYSSKVNEKLWIYRAIHWREDEAKRKDINKSRIFKNKEIKDIYRLCRQGSTAWKKHRQFKYAKQINWEKLNSFAFEKITPAEEAGLQDVQKYQYTIYTTESKELMTDILYTSLKFLLANTISMTLVLNKELIKRIVYNVGDPEILLPTWKREILGEDASNLLLSAHSKSLKISTDGIVFV